MKRKILKKNRTNKKRLLRNTEYKSLNIEKTNNFKMKKSLYIKNKFVFIFIIILFFVILTISLLLFLFLKKEKKYKPFLPINENEILVKDFHKTKYDNSHLRYHFEDMYENRTIFIINYSYLPYKSIKKHLSYEENGKYIFESTGMLNITLLDLYYGNNIEDWSKFNHIHVSIGTDENFALLSLITIASLLNNSSPDTFIHVHSILLNCAFEDIKKMYKLKSINKNVEFIFYNAKQAEYDFSRGKKERRGIGDYTRVLAPEIVNNTNRILILDTGDLIVEKDLSELYFFDLGDNYFAFILDISGGRYDTNLIFARSLFYPNTAVCLVNVRKFRKDNLYKEAFFAAIAYEDLPCPYQDIFLIISHFKFKYLPLNYNCDDFYNDERELKERTVTDKINNYMKCQKNSPFKYTLNEIFDAAIDPVITHLIIYKPQSNSANKIIMDKYRKYAKITGAYVELKNKYPKPFKDQ